MSEIGGRHTGNLFCCKDRSLLADIDRPHIAASAFADAAFHAVFECCVDVFFIKTKLLERDQGELDHDWRPADYGNTVVGRGGCLFEYGGHKTDTVFPVG